MGAGDELGMSCGGDERVVRVAYWQETQYVEAACIRKGPRCRRPGLDADVFTLLCRFVLALPDRAFPSQLGVRRCRLAGLRCLLEAVESDNVTELLGPTGGFHAVLNSMDIVPAYHNCCGLHVLLTSASSTMFRRLGLEGTAGIFDRIHAATEVLVSATSDPEFYELHLLAIFSGHVWLLLAIATGAQLLRLLAVASHPLSARQVSDTALQVPAPPRPPPRWTKSMSVARTLKTYAPLLRRQYKHLHPADEGSWLTIGVGLALYWGLSLAFEAHLQLERAAPAKPPPAASLASLIPVPPSPLHIPHG